jgi:hypothetical protein
LALERGELEPPAESKQRGPAPLRSAPPATGSVRGVLARVRGGLPFGPAGMREGLDAIDVLREGLSHAHHVAASAGGRQAGSGLSAATPGR